jgi:hypothetical protein
MGKVTGFNPRDWPSIHFTGCWIGPRAGLDGCWNSRSPPGFDPRTVQLVASRYTDWAIQKNKIAFVNNNSHSLDIDVNLAFFFVWRAPQQMLRTHRSLQPYCATVWWRWLIFFSFFQIMEHRWNVIYRGKPEYSGKNLYQCNFVHHKSHMDWSRDRTRASAVGGRQLTAWALPNLTLTHFSKTEF